MSMMKDTDQTLLHFTLSRVLEAFLDHHITVGEAAADLAHLCRPDQRHLNGPDLKSQLRRTLTLACSGEIDHGFALNHLVRLATTPVLFEDAA